MVQALLQCFARHSTEGLETFTSAWAARMPGIDAPPGRPRIVRMPRRASRATLPQKTPVGKKISLHQGVRELAAEGVGVIPGPHLHERLVQSNMEDIRSKPFLTPEDVLALGFIRTPARYVFRRYPRHGLRSHIMAVLAVDAVRREREGVLCDGIRRFPRARPLRVLRIFRTRFPSLAEAEEEIKRVKQVTHYLGPAFMALSEEFLVSCRVGKRLEILLCGLQEYVDGPILDPWGSLSGERLHGLAHRFRDEGNDAPAPNRAVWVGAVRRLAAVFVGRVKRLIAEAGVVPDLAGVGNLVLDRAGAIRLVDINNISRVEPGSAVPLDDRGYPVCDKSLEALFRIEVGLAGSGPDPGEEPYRGFLQPERIREAKRLERRFREGRREVEPMGFMSGG